MAVQIRDRVLYPDITPAFAHIHAVVRDHAIDLSHDLASAHDRAIALANAHAIACDHAIALNLDDAVAFAHALDRSFNLDLYLASALDLELERALDRDRARAVGRAVSRVVLLDRVVIGGHFYRKVRWYARLWRYLRQASPIYSTHVGDALSTYFSLAILEERIEGKLPAIEGIRITRVRKAALPTPASPAKATAP